jgi:hypothetical protein
MQSGIDVLANYESTTFTRCASSATHLVPQTGLGVLFPATVTESTVLDGFSIDRFAADTSAAVTVDGARGVTLSNLVIAGNPGVTGGPPVPAAYGVNVIDGGDALLFHDSIDPGLGSRELVGVRSVGSRVRIADSCSGSIDPATGRCDAKCSDPGPKISVTGNTPYQTLAPELLAAVVLESSPGSSVERSTVCARYSNNDCSSALGTAIAVQGDAAGVSVRASSIWAQSTTAYYCAPSKLSALSLSDCAHATPWIADNPHLTTTASPGSGLQALGIEVTDCRAVIDSNLHVNVQFDNVVPGHSGATAISCQASNRDTGGCVVAGNLDVSTEIGNLGPPPWSPDSEVGGEGIACGGCARVSNNIVVGVTAGSGSSGYAVSLVGAGVGAGDMTLLRDNVITGVGRGGYCRVRGYGVGGGGRIENNRIIGIDGGGYCGAPVMGPQYGYGLSGGSDVSSNFIASTLTCLSWTTSMFYYNDPPMDLLLQNGGGSYRNNVFGGACPLSVYEVSATSDPSVFEHNSMRGTYVDETYTNTITPAAVNSLTDMVTGGNLGACSLMPDFHLPPGSACIDAGSVDGAPLDDFDGKPRDATPDVGPDEYVP